MIQIPRIVMIVIAAQFSIDAVACAIALTYALAFVVNQNVVQSAVTISYSDLWHAVKGSGLIAVLTGTATFLVSLGLAMSGASDIVQLILGTLAAASSWSAAVFALRHPVSEEAKIIFHTVSRRFN
jgi:hypothetical protein